MIYTLMNQKKAVLDLNYDEDFQAATEITAIYNSAYAPLSLMDNQGISLKNLNNWLRRRRIPSLRDGLNDLLSYLGIPTTADLALKNLALSLSDQYWLCPEESYLTWEEVNFFQNDYNSLAFSDGTFGSSTNPSGLSYTSGLDPFHTPNNTAEGMLRKVWLRDQNGQNYLYKAANSNFNLEPVNEALATLICECLEVPHVPYKIKRLTDRRRKNTVSVCPCMINENEEIVTASDILRTADQSEGKTMYCEYLRRLENKNVPRAEEYLQKMWMLDYLMMNEDRYLNNFGIIRDGRTLEWTRICPIYDTGRAMNTTLSRDYWTFDDEKAEIKFFTRNFCACSCLTDIFTISVSRKQLNALRKLVRPYQSLLESVADRDHLNREIMETLTAGWLSRVDQFEKVLKMKGLIVE